MKSNVTRDMAYIGQSGRPITTRHREHIRYIRTNNPNSAYEMHILNNKHEKQPHTDTFYNKCKSTFQFSNLAKYSHGPPEDGFKGD